MHCGLSPFDATYMTRMVLQNQSAIAARLSSGTAGTGASAGTDAAATTTAAATTNAGRMGGRQGPIIVDLLVTMIAVPILILCALQLEKNLHDMTNSPESHWLVFALGIALLIVSVIICGYVTHRMGVCIWTGPIDEAQLRHGGVPHINSQNDILRIVDTLPPSYESVVKFDIPPPPYDCLIIDMEQCKEEDDGDEQRAEGTAPPPLTAARPANNGSGGSKEQRLPDVTTVLHI